MISTRKRQNRLEVRLNDSEDVKLHELMCETGFNASQLIRSLISRTEIKTRPPDELPKLLRELSDNIAEDEVTKMRVAFENLSKEVRKL